MHKGNDGLLLLYYNAPVRVMQTPNSRNKSYPPPENNVGQHSLVSVSVLYQTSKAPFTSSEKPTVQTVVPPKDNIAKVGIDYVTLHILPSMLRLGSSAYSYRNTTPVIR